MKRAAKPYNDYLLASGCFSHTHRSCAFKARSKSESANITLREDAFNRPASLALPFPPLRLDKLRDRAAADNTIPYGSGNFASKPTDFPSCLWCCQHQGGVPAPCVKSRRVNNEYRASRFAMGDCRSSTSKPSSDGRSFPHKRLVVSKESAILLWAISLYYQRLIKMGGYQHGATAFHADGYGQLKFRLATPDVCHGIHLGNYAAERSAGIPFVTIT